MEWVLWLTYLSGGAFWVAGYLLFLPLGFFSYTIWMQNWAWIGLVQMLTDGKDLILYLNGPLRRFIVGSIIFNTAALLLWIPGLNLVLAPLLGWLALLDYYDYDYQLPF